MLFETGSCPNRAFHLIDENPGWLSATRKLPETAFEDGEMLNGACFCRSFNCRKNDDIVAKALSQIGDPAIPAATSLLRYLCGRIERVEIGDSVEIANIHAI
jgi:hypothetical protein